MELIIIDYLQLMSAKDGKNNGNREQEISTISRSIKEIAKELNVPIIALASLADLLSKEVVIKSQSFRILENQEQ